MTTKLKNRRPAPRLRDRRPAVLASSIAALLALCLAPSSTRAQTWLATPGSGDWNTAINWTPATVPNSATAIATFGSSSTTAVSVSAFTQVGGITFTASAKSPYTITITPSSSVNTLLTISGGGITNNSGVIQNFVTAVDGSGDAASISFTNKATAGSLTKFTNQGGTASGTSGGSVIFEDSSTAGSATITSNGGTGGGTGGAVYFEDTSDGGTASATTNGNGVFDISDLSNGGMKIGSIAGSGNYFLGSKTLTVGGNNLSTIVSGVIADRGQESGAGGSLVKTGTGTLTLTGSNTYTGTTTVNAGILQIGNGTTGNLTTSSVMVSGTGSLVTDLLDLSGFTPNIALSASGASLKAIQSGTTTFSGVISGTGVFDFNGSGTTIFTGKNTYTGATTINNGTLQVGTTGTVGAIAAGSAVSLAGGGTLELVNVSGNVFANSVSSAGSTFGFVDVDSANTTTLSGKLTDGGGQQLELDQTGSGTTILTNSGNTYSAATSVTGGVLQIGTSTTTGSIGAKSGVFISTGTFSLVNIAGNKLVNNVKNDFGGLGTLLIDSANANTLSGTLTNGAAGQLALTQSGSGTTILTNAGNTYSGATTVSGGTLQIGATGTAGSIGGTSAVGVGNGATLSIINVSGGVLANSITNGLGGTGLVKVDATTSVSLSGILSNGANVLALTQSGTGTTTLTGNNTYGGLTTITAGTLQIGNGGTSGQLGTGNIVDNGTLAFDLSGSLTVSGGISGKGSIHQNGTGTTILQGSGTYTGAINVNAGTLEVDGSLVAVSTVTVATTGTLAGGGTIGGKATLTGNGTIDLSTNGDIAGTLAVTGGKWNGMGTVTGLVTSSSGDFAIGNGANLTAPAGLAVSGGMLTGAGTLTGSLNYTSTSSSTFGGVIAGTGTTLTMNKAGSTLALLGSNTYTGATTVSGGTLLADNTTGSATGSGAVTVNSAAILGGTGTISGPVTINTGGVLAPGSSNNPATLTLDALTLKTGAKVDYELGGAGATGAGANDLTVVNGNVALGGTLNITAGFGFGAGNIYDLFNYTGSVPTGTISLGTLPTGYTASDFSITTNPTTKQVNLTVTGGPTTVQYWNPAAGSPVQGGTGTWDSSTTSWTDSQGANSATLGTKSVALFSAGGGMANSPTAVTIDSTVTAAQIGFLPGAGAYTITVGTSSLTSNIYLYITAGITNNSGVVQNFVTNFYSGFIAFSGSGSAGNQTQFTNQGPGATGYGGGGTYFGGTSSAGSATFLNQGGSVSGGLYGGFTEFYGSASAGTAILTNYAGTNGGLGGVTEFDATATGGMAQVINTGAPGDADGGVLDISYLTSTSLQLGSIAGGGFFDLGGKILTVGGNNMSTVVSGVIADGGYNGGKGASLVKTGTGTLTLTGANTYTGATTVNMGALQIGDGVTTGTSLATSGVTASGTGTLAIDLSDQSLFATKVALSVATASLDAIQSGANTLSGVISGTGVLDQNGTGTTILTSTETYTGATNVNAGTLQIGNGTTGNLAATTIVTVASGATLELDLANGATFSSKVIDKGQISASGLTTDNYTIASAISGTGSLTKGSGNIVTMTGANTYSGGTVINAGTLLVKNTTGSGMGAGAVTVNSAATLGGSGTISGATTLNSGGFIAPGASAAAAGTTLHAASLTWNPGGTINLQLGASKADILALSGALTMGSSGTGNFTLDLLNAGLSTTKTYTYTLVTFASTTFAQADFTLELPTNFTGTLIETSTSLEIENLTDPPPVGELPEGADLAVKGTVASGLSTPDNLTVTPTPEPGSATLLVFGGAALLGWRRRSRG